MLHVVWCAIVYHPWLLWGKNVSGIFFDCCKRLFLGLPSVTVCWDSTPVAGLFWDSTPEAGLFWKSTPVAGLLLLLLENLVWNRFWSIWVKGLFLKGWFWLKNCCGGCPKAEGSLGGLWSCLGDEGSEFSSVWIETINTWGSRERNWFRANCWTSGGVARNWLYA